MKHAKARFGRGTSWRDPQTIGLNVALGLTYILGLLCFHRALGLGWNAPGGDDPAPGPRTPVISSEDALAILSHYEKHRPDELGNRFLFRRHLLQTNGRNDSEADSTEAGVAADSEETGNKTAAEESGSTSNGTLEVPTEVTGDEPEQDPLFPKDLFTLKQKKQGAVVLHIIGVIYMFIALAIVCDEFFVPSLDVIIEKLRISEDVAGATFMAAGGSSPELFTAAIGVFIAFSDVGIGTIVGSAVFNILFVIGMCTLFSKTVLKLTWWPLFRDCTFYSIALIMLILFFLDNIITWWEALVLLGWYTTYCIFMKFNSTVERKIKRLLSGNRVAEVANPHQQNGVAGGPADRMSSGVPVFHSGSHFRHGVLQLMIHTIDPLHDGKVDEKAAQLHAIATLKVLMEATNGGHNGAGGETNGGGQPQPLALMNGVENGNHAAPYNSGPGVVGVALDPQVEEETEEEEQSKPVDISWPSTNRERITYLIVIPIIFPLWLTLPDTKKESSRKYFPITFIGSILWIAAFSYFMVWWATVSGDIVGIPPEVMGLTFLAAGTSVPDLITSVIVARKGFGDMAVSSSVGSNIFDVTVGLPLPWLLYTLAFDSPVPVRSDGMVCSIVLLFGMLCLVFFSILIFNWKMTQAMGIMMFVFYFGFVFVSLSLTYHWISCPIEISLLL